MVHFWTTLKRTCWVQLINRINEMQRPKIYFFFYFFHSEFSEMTRQSLNITATYFWAFLFQITIWLCYVSASEVASGLESHEDSGFFLVQNICFIKRHSSSWLIHLEKVYFAKVVKYSWSIKRLLAVRMKFW